MNKIQNERWVDALPDEAVKVAEDINIEIAKVIAERIKAIGKLSPSDIKKLSNSLQYLGADFQKITRLIAQYSKKGQTAVVDMLKKTADANDEFADVFYSAKGIAAHTWRTDAYLNSLVEAMARQTVAHFTNLSNTLAYKIDDRTLPLRQMYTQAIDKAIYEVHSGTTDYYTAMRKTIRQLSDDMRVVKWESGYVRRLDSHVRQNMLDGVKQLNQQMMNYHGAKFGADGVELSAHAICAPDHLPVQGRQFSNAEFNNMQSGLTFEDVKGNQYSSFRRPIGEWNCRHFAFPIIIGISQPAYTEEQLKKYAENSAAKYELTQVQRAMETKLRKLKNQRLVQSAAGDELGAKQTQRKINELQAKYRKFSENNNIAYQPKRATVEGYRRISVSASKETTAKFLNKSANNDIIKKDNSNSILTMDQTVEKAKEFAKDNEYNSARSTQEIRAITNKKLGYDGLPQTISSADFETLSQRKNVLYRGVHSSETKSAKDIVDEFKNGFLWTGNSGGAIYGNGIYFDTSLETAKEYAENTGEIIETILSDDIKIADFSTLFKEFEKTGIPKIIGLPQEDYQYIIRDIGQYAAVKGYDVIALNGFQNHNYWVVLNRTKCIVRE